MSVEYSDLRYQLWLTFWQSPWEVMDESWLVSLPHHPGSPSMGALKTLSPTLLRTYLFIDPVPPVTPGEVLQQWVSLSQDEKCLALRFAAHVVWRAYQGEGLDESDKQWCRHLAKALLPGTWSVAQWHEQLLEEEMGLILLRQWMSPHTWQRARLCFSHAMLDTIETRDPDPIPVIRLNQLWHGVMWRLATGRVS